jgi:FMN phosphatase YigB (HAD superfamily)
MHEVWTRAVLCFVFQLCLFCGFSYSSFVPISFPSHRWARGSIPDSMVRAVSNAWEMERHHASERHLYPEVLNVLTEIRKQHPTAIIGAVTDGRSNPMLMTFTLGRFFDFACSWEDDQGNRQKFFKDLEKTGGDTSQLTWIYEEARYNYALLKQAAAGMSRDNRAESIPELVFPDTYDDRCWIHVGDDLAFDVGGSKACGAKTIYCELADRYGQTARHRFDGSAPQPSWSSTPDSELKMRYEMSEAAKDKVDVALNFLSQLPEAINEIMGIPSSFE